MEVIERQVVAARQGRDQPEEMPGLDVVGIRLHDLPAKLLGLRQLAGLIVPPGRIKRRSPSLEDLPCRVRGFATRL